MEYAELRRQIDQEMLRLAMADFKASRAEEQRFFDWLDRRQKEGPRPVSVKLPDTASPPTRTTA